MQPIEHRKTADTPRGRNEFFAPAPLAAMALLALNDHVLKPLLHNELSGKLSDLALCFVLPLLLSAVLRPLWPRGRVRLLVATLVAGATFTVLELSLTADAWFSTIVAALGRPFGVHGAVFTKDPTDLLALVMAPLAYLYGRHRLAMAEATPRRGSPWTWLPVRLRRGLGLGATLVLLVADQPDPCDETWQPVMFEVSGECGAPGTIVVEQNGEHGVRIVGGDPVLGVVEGGKDVCTFNPARDRFHGIKYRCHPSGAGASGDAGSGDAGTTDAGGSENCAGLYNKTRECSFELDASGERSVSCFERSCPRESAQPCTVTGQCKARVTVKK